MFCGYSKDCLTQARPSKEDFLKQVNSYLQEYGIPNHFEIYNSGSFLDDRQVSPKARIAMFREMHRRGVESVAIESRPEYIKPETLTPLIAEFKGDLTVSIGLEVADDFILRKLKKGFSLDDVEKAHSVLKSMDLSSRAYLLVGAPFTGNAKTATLDSVRYSQEIGFDELSLLGAYPMEASAGYHLWKSGKWLPLEVNSFNEIIISAKEIKPDIDFSSDGLEGFWKREEEKLNSS